MKLKTLYKHKCAKVKKYYRLAGQKKDTIQFNNTYSDPQGYTKLTKDIEKDGYTFIK